MIDRLRGIFLLCLLYIPAAYFAMRFRIGIPGAVAGLLLCLVAMLAIPRLQILIRPGAQVVLALVPLFLVPLLVRMALTLDFGALRTWLIVLVVAICSLAGVVLCALSVKFCLQGGEDA